eukprot:scaffold281319_cov31-Tisochrysis_lutea.AAC.2
MSDAAQVLSGNSLRRENFPKEWRTEEKGSEGGARILLCDSSPHPHSPYDRRRCRTLTIIVPLQDFLRPDPRPAVRDTISTSTRPRDASTDLSRTRTGRPGCNPTC